MPGEYRPIQRHPTADHIRKEHVWRHISTGGAQWAARCYTEAAQKGVRFADDTRSPSHPAFDRQRGRQYTI